jgi:large repetitive protein
MKAPVILAARRSIPAAVLLLASLLPANPASAAITAAYAGRGSQDIAPGVTYRWGDAQATSGPQVVRIAHVDTAQSGIQFRTSLPRDKVNAREKTTAQALRFSAEGRRVVAALNGPTFNSYPGTHYSARGLNVQDGEITSANPRGAGPLLAFGVDSRGRARIGTPSYTVEVTVPGGGSGSVDRVNSGRRPGETVIFTPRFDSHTWTGTDGDEYVIEGVDLPLRLTGSYSGRVAAIRRAAGDSPIAAGQLILSTSGAKAELFRELKLNDRLTIDLAIEPAWQDTVQAIGAKQMIVRNGNVDIQPYDLDDINNAHPRSAIGVTARGDVIMVAVEGRSTTSAGLKLDDLAQLMLDLGAVEALNLDGGGSTTLALRQPGDFEVSVANTLSGGGTTSVGEERTVSNTIQVVSTFSTGALRDVLVSPSGQSVAIGQSLQFTAKGHDRYYNGVKPTNVGWAASGGNAISASGLLTAKVTGEHTVTATSGGLAGSVALTITAALPPPTVPSGLTALAEPARYVKLAWKAAQASASGTIKYRLFRDGVGIGSQQTALSYTDRPAAGTHKYQVLAIDAAGNKSAKSAIVKVIAFATGPSPPTGLKATARPGRYVELGWNASGWGSGTIKYRVYRDGLAIGVKQTALSYTDRPTVGKHKYQLRAIDAAGNKSVLSLPLTITAFR